MASSSWFPLHVLLIIIALVQGSPVAPGESSGDAEVEAAIHDFASHFNATTLKACGGGGRLRPSLRKDTAERACIFRCNKSTYGSQNEEDDLATTQCAQREGLCCFRTPKTEILYCESHSIQEIDVFAVCCQEKKRDFLRGKCVEQEKQGIKN